VAKNRDEDCESVDNNNEDGKGGTINQHHHPTINILEMK